MFLLLVTNEYVGKKGTADSVVSVRLPIHMPMHMIVHTLLHLSIRMPMHMPVHMSIHMSIHMSVHMSVHMSMHMSGNQDLSQRNIDRPVGHNYNYIGHNYIGHNYMGQEVSQRNIDRQVDAYLHPPSDHRAAPPPRSAHYDRGDPLARGGIYSDVVFIEHLQ